MADDLPHAALVNAPLDVETLAARVAHPSAGATSLFVGAVRETHEGRSVARIDYEAYAPMAAAELKRAAEAVGDRYAGTRIAVEHRLGTLGVGEASVAIAVSHAHRQPAIEACASLIDELKRRVPIWKREHFSDGTFAWVDPTRQGQAREGGR